MIPTFQISHDQLSGNFIRLDSLDDLADGEFLQITSADTPSTFMIAQKCNCVTDGGIITSVARLVYRSDKDLYPVFYYAIGKLMYHSLMYLRHLPIGRFNRFLEKERLDHELSNIKITLSIFSNAANTSDLLSNIWINLENPECAQLIALAKESPSNAWKITEIRKQLFDILADRMCKIEILYKAKKYKGIREVGYELHNVPEMICLNKVFSNNFANYNTMHLVV